MSFYSQTIPVSDLLILGKAIALSGMYGAKNEPQGVIIAWHIVANGLDPFEPALTYHLVEGKLTMKADAILAKFHERGGQHRWIQDGTDGKCAEIELTKNGQKVTYKFTIEQARTAGLIKPQSNWIIRPGNMLRARAVSDAMTMIDPGAKRGCYTPEELEDLPGEQTTGLPTPQAAPATEAVETEASKPKRGRPPKQAEPDPAKPAEALKDGSGVSATETPAPAPAPVAEVTPPAEAKPEQATPEQATPATPAPADVPPLRLVTNEQLHLIAERKNALGIPAMLWSQVLSSIDVPVDPADGKRKVKLSTASQADQILQWLTSQKELINAKKAGNEAEAWAEAALTKPLPTQQSLPLT